MEPVASPLSGFWGYLLIGELAGLTALSWVTIGIFIRKLRYPEASPINEAEATQQSVSVEESAAYKALLGKCEALEAEKAQWVEKTPSPEASEVEKMKETIAFLENRLLSYEIVQEEISSLGELKAENEKLKLEIQALKSPSVVSGPIDSAIEKKFSEFSDTKPSTEENPASPLPGEISSLLTDIEKLSQK